MARYKGREVPHCLVDSSGEVVALWEEGNRECMKCSVEAMCQEAQIEVEMGEFSYEDRYEAKRSTSSTGYRPVTRPATTQVQTRPVPTTQTAPRGPRINELQLAIPRSRRILAYEGETDFQRLGKNVILGAGQSTALEVAMWMGAQTWEPPREKTITPEEVYKKDLESRAVESEKALLKEKRMRKELEGALKKTLEATQAKVELLDTRELVRLLEESNRK